MSEKHQCVSEGQLLELAAGSLPEEQAQRLLQYIETCSDCTVLFEEAGHAIAEHKGDEYGPPAPQAINGSFQPGQLIAGRYRIEHLLGRGGMGEVYQALDTELSESVALKTIRRQLAADTQAVERFKTELRLARRVVHPNVCRVLEFGRHRDPRSEHSSAYFITMELLRGEPLSRLLRRSGRLPLREALNILIQAAEGLEAIHSEGVLHRDIKTNNILLCQNTLRNNREPLLQELRAVLLDFGVARNQELEGAERPSTQGTPGTPDYMAPEQLESGRLSAATDVYSLGIVMFELLTGKLPFEGSSAFTRAVLRLRERAPAPSSLVPGIPKEVDQLSAQCLNYNPQERPVSAAALAQSLRQLRVPNQPKRTLGAGAHITPAANHRSANRGKYLAGALLLAASAGVLIVRAPSQEGSPPDAYSVEETVVLSLSSDKPSGPEIKTFLSSQSASTADATREGVDPSTALSLETKTPAPPPARTVAVVAPSARPSKPNAPRTHRERRKTRAKSSSARPLGACDPPYYYDAQGIRVYRKACL